MQWIGYRSLGGNLIERRLSELLTGRKRHSGHCRVRDQDGKSRFGRIEADDRRLPETARKLRSGLRARVHWKV